MKSIDMVRSLFQSKGINLSESAAKRVVAIVEEDDPVGLMDDEDGGSDDLLDDVQNVIDDLQGIAMELQDAMGDEATDPELGADVDVDVDELLSDDGETPVDSVDTVVEPQENPEMELTDADLDALTGTPGEDELNLGEPDDPDFKKDND